MTIRRRGIRATAVATVVALVAVFGVAPAAGTRAAGPAKDYAQSIERAIADVQQFWAETFPAVYGAAYQPVPDDRIVAASPGTEIPTCEDFAFTYDNVSGNAVYLACNMVVYDDFELFPRLYSDYGGFALALVLAHEWGHATQDRAGLWDAMSAVVSELQADCFAGAWSRYVHDGHGRSVVRPGALDSALVAMLQIFGDSPGSDPTDSDAHGSAFDRAAAFQQGFDDGAAQCATYATTPPQIFEVVFADEQDAASGGDLPLDQLIDVITEVLDAFYTQVEPEFEPLGVENVFQYDATGPKRQLPSCGGTKLKRPAAAKQVVFCQSESFVAFDAPFVTKVYKKIGDMGVATLFAKTWAVYVERLQHFPGIAKHSDNTVLAADCYTGGFAAALNAGSLTSPTLEGNVALSAGDLDETLWAFILSSGTSSAGGSADVTFARLRAFRDGFFNGFAGCAATYSDTGITMDEAPQ